MRKGFTLIELLVVVAMILILAGAMTTSIVNAQRRSRISRAETETREITNAILAFANYAETGDLQGHEMEDAEAEEGKLGFILGKETSRGEPVPVLYNAALRNGKILDPWGRPYRITIKRGERVSPPGIPNMQIQLFYPNWHRLSEAER